MTNFQIFLCMVGYVVMGCIVASVVLAIVTDGNSFIDAFDDDDSWVMIPTGIFWPLTLTFALCALPMMLVYRGTTWVKRELANPKNNVKAVKS